MATLRLVRSKDDDKYEYLLSKGQGVGEDAEFAEFRKKYYHYYYEFYRRSGNSEPAPKLVLYYERLFNVDVNSDVVEEESVKSNAFKYHLDVIVDFSLSIRKAKKQFEKTAREIWSEIELLYESREVSDNILITDYPKNARGVKVDLVRMFELWDKLLKVHDLYEKQDEKNKSQISREMGWYDNNDASHCSEEVNNYLKYAKRLIDAASNGNFYKESCKAMTSSRNRKKT